MDLRLTILTAVGALCLAASPPSVAMAQGTGTVTCQSNGSKRVHCAVPNIDPGSVTMEKKLSSTNCYLDQNWGTDDQGVWVSGGCRAIFAYARYGGGNGGNNGASAGRGGSITCGSANGKRTSCSVPGIDPQSVTMDNKLSQANCYRDQTWGASSKGIWVDKGCRAEFGYVTHGGGGNNNGSDYGSNGISESSARQACIDRASSDWAVTTSNLEVTSADRQQNGSYRVAVQSKRTSGTCMVDRNGNVYQLNAN
jgi:hypothetical protein